jgi:hypothetical protein
VDLVVHHEIHVSSFDRLEVHERPLTRRLRGLRDIRVDRLVRQRLDKVALSTPLGALWKERVKQRLHRGKGHRTHPVGDGLPLARTTSASTWARFTDLQILIVQEHS